MGASSENGTEPEREASVVARTLVARVTSWFVVGATLALATGAFVFAGACLPDLAPFPPAPEAGETPIAPPAFGCGDGVIETLDDGGDAGESCDPGDASTAGCESCRFMCPDGAVDDAGHCYFFVESTASYGDAVSACRREDGHVVTFSSLRELAFTSALAGDAGAHWVGLTFDNTLAAYGPPPEVNEPGWPSSGNTCTGCFAAGADDAGAFAVLPGEDASTPLQCLVAQQGTWLQVPCVGARPRRTLCEREPAGQRIYPCGGLLCTTVPVTLGAKRYVIWQFPQTADEASSICKTSYDGGSLVMFESREEREQLVREIAQRLSTGTDPLELWFGLSNVNGTWTWDDGTPLDMDHAGRPPPWGNGQPMSNTGRAFLFIDDAVLDTQLARADPEPGSKSRYFICQRPID